MENEQIDVIMEKEGLNASQFAAAIGIQRAQVSHLQSKRNRVSLDIVQRIHAAFPAISTEWLLTGSGGYYAEGYPPSLGIQASAQPAERSQDWTSLRVDAVDAPSDQGNVASEEPKRVQEATLFGEWESPVIQDKIVASPAKREVRKGEGVSRAAAASPVPPVASSQYALPAAQSESVVPQQPAMPSFEGQGQKAKSIVEIKIFYDDGTYETFRRQ